MVQGSDEPLWDVDLLKTELRDKNKLDDAVFPGRPDKIAWRYGRPGIKKDCGVAVNEFCNSHMSGAVWATNPYYAVKSFDRPPLTSSLKFPDRRLNGSIGRIIGALKKKKAVIVGLARMGPSAKVALVSEKKSQRDLAADGKIDRPLQSFHAVAIVACDKGGFYFLYLDSMTDWSNCYYSRTRYIGMGYIVYADALIAPDMAGDPACVIWGP